MKLQIFEVISVVVLKRHVVQILFPVNLAVNLQSVYFDKDEGCKQPCKKDIVYLATGLITCSVYYNNFVTCFIHNYPQFQTILAVIFNINLAIDYPVSTLDHSRVARNSQ